MQRVIDTCYYSLYTELGYMEGGVKSVHSAHSLCTNYGGGLRQDCPFGQALHNRCNVNSIEVT